MTELLESKISNVDSTLREWSVASFPTLERIEIKL
jgi:hypothetical protein